MVAPGRFQKHRNFLCDLYSLKKQERVKAFVGSAKKSDVKFLLDLMHDVFVSKKIPLLDPKTDCRTVKQHEFLIENLVGCRNTFAKDSEEEKIVYQSLQMCPKLIKVLLKPVFADFETLYRSGHQGAINAYQSSGSSLPKKNNNRKKTVKEERENAGDGRYTHSDNNYLKMPFRESTISENDEDSPEFQDPLDEVFLDPFERLQFPSSPLRCETCRSVMS